ncbi:hypothetical protein OEZ86_005425 [Tetradesmus obliquus]|uniref:4'-phosphopantetheinyl transferase domain-containing protein n=1 Tax=Tetradesmus obliquus TaxID=3088 RepID=A0ABY8TTB1_TETOB|nr:hypothetical protein OEZ85_012303 [Tetradesmus obliquus]WIA39309.1 hypothetical protein OEZ86_005425 [Tetradesmus obliquus]
MDTTISVICLLAPRNETAEFLMKSQKMKADADQVAGKSADEVKQLIANKYAVKDTAFKAIVAVVLNRHDTNINSSGKEEPLTATMGRSTSTSGCQQPMEASAAAMSCWCRRVLHGLRHTRARRMAGTRS